MHAIISDLHSNLEALVAVLEDIREQGADEILCLGDVVGYGPDPEECIDLVEKECRFCLSGNHDYAVLNSAERFNPLAEEAVDFTRRRLKPGLLKGDGFKRLLRLESRSQARWRFLQELLLDKRELDFYYVHGSPRDKRNEYILETDIVFGNVEKIEEIFSILEGMGALACFVGHTHVPGVITSDFRFLRPADMPDAAMPLDRSKRHIVNVGSTGQPRDGDNRACYLLADEETIRYRRVEYDFEETIRKSKSIGPLSQQHGDRLREGR